jgi:hypothetical protein
MITALRQNRRHLVVTGLVLICTNALYTIGWTWINGLSDSYACHRLRNTYPVVTSFVIDHHAGIIVGLNALNLGALFTLVLRRDEKEYSFAGLFLITWGMVIYLMLIAWAILRAFFFELCRT